MSWTNFTHIVRELVGHAVADFRRMHADVRQLRRFGFVVGGIFVGIAIGGAWWFSEVSTLLRVLFVAGGILVSGALFIPTILSLPYRLWMGLSLVAGLIVGNLVFAILYYAAVTPIGLVRRAVSPDPLSRAFDRSASSYFVPHEDVPKDRMLRPF